MYRFCQKIEDEFSFSSLFSRLEYENSIEFQLLMLLLMFSYCCRCCSSWWCSTKRKTEFSLEENSNRNMILEQEKGRVHQGWQQQPRNPFHHPLCSVCVYRKPWTVVLILLVFSSLVQSLLLSVSSLRKDCLSLLKTTESCTAVSPWSPDLMSKRGNNFRQFPHSFFFSSSWKEKDCILWNNRER